MSSAIHSVERAVDRTRSSFVDLGAQALKLVNSLRAAEMRHLDTMLHQVGLQRRNEAPRPLVWFAAGAIASGAIVLLLAPESGKKLRDHVVQVWESRFPHRARASGGADGARASHDVEQELAHRGA